MTPKDRPPPRPIKALLISNRGEIATRILAAAREHPGSPLTTYTLATRNDTGHTLHSDHTLELRNAGSYLDIDCLISLIRKHEIDAVHPGYGFLSESAEFAKRAWEEAGAVVVGPGWGVLERTGDKLRARELAEECGVDTLPGMRDATGDVQVVRRFVEGAGLPVIIKAVDGGGGRGIRLVRDSKDLEDLARRAIAESPSRQVFVEKAAVEGFRHVEVQIIGDGTGEVRHLWERECSIQRRYQKIIEIAPSTIPDRRFVARIIQAAVRMAQKINYFSLGTFEFLANPQTGEFFFLEVNPRLQVEHTITESISQIDIVQTQLQLQEGAGIAETALGNLAQDAARAPTVYAVQLRICAENAYASFSLSIGRISSFQFPCGNGIRVDTALVAGHEAVVSADYDSLIAKLIITASSWEAVVLKARRALEDTRIVGVQTNLDVLRAIVSTKDFEMGQCDTTWLEGNMPKLLDASKQISASLASKEKSFAQSSTAATTGLSSSTVLLRKGDAWSIRLIPANAQGREEEDQAEAVSHHLKLEKVLRNEFPNSFSAQIAYATPALPEPQSFNMTLTATSASSSSTMAEGKHRRGNVGDDAHVVIPFAGKLLEVLVEEGDVLKDGDVVCVVQQMKMELEVRCRKGGRVRFVMDVEEGEDVAEGDLAVELELTDDVRPKL